MEGYLAVAVRVDTRPSSSSYASSEKPNSTVTMATTPSRGKTRALILDMPEASMRHSLSHVFSSLRGRQRLRAQKRYSNTLPCPMTMTDQRPQWSLSYMSAPRLAAQLWQIHWLRTARGAARRNGPSNPTAGPSDNWATIVGGEACTLGPCCRLAGFVSSALLSPVSFASASAIAVLRGVGHSFGGSHVGCWT